MPGLNKVECSDIVLGMRFNKPVFFEDGKNMFLARGKTVKEYHLRALKQWNIPYLLTAGEEIKEVDDEESRQFAQFAKLTGKEKTDDIEELEEVEELEELDDVEDAEEVEEL